MDHRPHPEPPIIKGHTVPVWIAWLDPETWWRGLLNPQTRTVLIESPCDMQIIVDAQGLPMTHRTPDHVPRVIPPFSVN